jgi:hypothetical protein
MSGSERDWDGDDGGLPPRYGTAGAWPRQAGDDFFCHRFNVWYRTHDCAVRTKFRTYDGCLGCDQGRFNLRRHAASLTGIRFPLIIGE